MSEELKRLSDRYKKLADDHRVALTTINALRAENEQLNDRLNDYQNDYEKVINDKCPTDERHCGCVQILRKAINNYQNALVLITTFPSSSMQTFAEREMQRAACDVLEDDVGQKIDACKYWVEKVDYLQTELNHRNAVIASLEAELTAERERNRWIPVGERLPDNPDYLFIEPVLICHGDDEIVSAVYYKGDLLADDIGFYINELMDEKLNDVTYWRPIVPPEVE